MRHVGRLGRGNQDFAVGTDADPLRLDSDRHLRHHFPRRKVDCRHQGIVLVGDVDRAAGGMNVELLGIGSGGERADDLVGGDVKDLHRVLIARADQQRFAVARQHDAARALANGDGLLDLQTGAVDHADRVTLFIRDIDRVSNRGSGDAGQATDRRDDGDEDLFQSHRLNSRHHLNLHLLSGASIPSVSISASWCRKPGCGEVETGRSGPTTRMG